MDSLGNRYFPHSYTMNNTDEDGEITLEAGRLKSLVVFFSFFVVGKDGNRHVDFALLHLTMTNLRTFGDLER